MKFTTRELVAAFDLINDLGDIFPVNNPTASIADMKRHQEEAAKILAQDPNVEGFMTSVGAGGTRGGRLSPGRRGVTFEG